MLRRRRCSSSRSGDGSGDRLGCPLRSVAESNSQVGRQLLEDLNDGIFKLGEVAAEVERGEPVDGAPEFGSDPLGILATDALGTNRPFGVMDQRTVGVVQPRPAFRSRRTAGP